MKTFLLAALVSILTVDVSAAEPNAEFKMDIETKSDPALLEKLTAIDAKIREKFEMTGEHTAVGLLDLSGDQPRVAMINPDREIYAASVPKAGILLAYFATHPDVAADGSKLDLKVRHELGEMIKISSNVMASKYSHIVGLKKVQAVLDEYHFYDKDHGGGIWVGKHYGKDAEKYPSPVGKNSHAANVRQLLRFYLLLEQKKLVSATASKTMREVFESPDIKHSDNKFVKGLKGRDVQIIRKSGTWENWLHDTAVITGPGRHYVLVALTEHKKGDDYLVELAPAVDDLMKPQGK